MPTKGEVAYGRLQTLASDRSNLQKAINKLGGTGCNMQSCNLNNAAVVSTLVPARPWPTAMIFGDPAKKIGTYQLPHDIDKAPVPPSAMTADIYVKAMMGLIGDGKIVYFTVTPDHYFNAFSLNADTVIVSQGFQDSYDLVDWFAATRGGKFQAKEFEVLLERVAHRELGAIVLLCSYSATTHEAVAKYFAGSFSIQRANYLSLPAS